MTIANHVQLSGGGKALDRETGSFSFSTTTETAEIPTSLSLIHNATFVLAPGTAGHTTSTENVLITEAAIGTATGDITVSGTSLAVTRDVEIGGTATSGASYFYSLEGKS